MKKIISIILILILLAGAFGGVWYFSNGFDGMTSTFLVKYGGNVYLQDSDLGEVRSGAAFEVYSVEEYDVRIDARAGSDIKYTVGAEEYSWADLAGKELTGSFDVEKTGNGFSLSYSGLSGILTEYYGMQVEVMDAAEKSPAFDLTLITSKSELRLSFRLSLHAGSISVSEDHIIFYQGGAE